MTATTDPTADRPADRPAETAADPVERLLGSLDLDRVDDDRFVAENPDPGYTTRVFGGQVAAQALRAAAATVVGDERVAHSLHAYFLRPGRPGVPIEYRVEHTRDGRAFSGRRVTGHQVGDRGDELIFELSASFHVPEDGVDYQAPLPPGVPDPDEAPENWLFIPPEARDLLPMQIKELGAAGPDEHGFWPSTRRAWMRIRRPIGDDPVLHQCVLTFLSDMGAVFGAIAPLPEQPPERITGASLDHAVWFHRPLRADEWFLYDLHALSNAGARGTTRGTLHAADGTLGASMAQEALLRVAPPPG